jgi:hypothetical protein
LIGKHVPTADVKKLAAAHGAWSGVREGSKKEAAREG